MGQLDAAGPGVADDIQVGQAGAAGRISRDAAALKVRAVIPGKQPLGGGAAAGGDQHALGAHPGGIALCIGILHQKPALCLADLLHCGLCGNRHALLFQGGGQPLAQLPVHGGQQAVGQFQNRHPAAEGTVHAGHLNADDPAADDDQRGQGFAPARQQVIAGVHAGQLPAGDGRQRGDGPGGSDDVGGFIPGIAAQNHALGGHLRGALHHCHPAGLHQAPDALAQRVHRAGFVVMDGGPVKGGAPGAQAQGLGTVQRPPGVRRVQQRLGGDAAPVQAGAAQLVLLKQNDR